MSGIEPESISPHEFAAHVASFLTDGDDQPDQETDTAPEAPAELEGDTTETSEPELILDEKGNLHDPETGKFVRKATDEEIASVATDEEVVDEEPEEPSVDGEFELVIDDPDVEAFLAKYNGDLNKALKGAVEASKTLGRQGSELGELRQLQGKVEALQEMIAVQNNRPAPAAPYINYEALIDEDPKRAAHVAMQNGNVDAMMAAVNAWSDLGEPRDAFEASTFLNNVLRGYEMEQLREELKASAPAAPAASQSDGAEVAEVLKKHPDLEKFLPAIGEIAQERPFLRQALESGTPAEQATALEDLYLLARSRQDPADTSEAIRKIRVRTSEESKKARADAAVVSASRGSAASGDQPTRVDSFLDAFDSHMRDRGLLADEES